jgi:conjugal transfer pilus assembly protein TraV
MSAALALSGCALFHSNIKGGFSCSAPRGTCAPSMVIDDAALREIGAKPDDRRSSHRDDGEGQAEDKGGSTDQALPQDSDLAQSRDRVAISRARPALKIVYPAWRDAAGRLHPRTSAYAPVEVPLLTAADVVPLDAGHLGAARGSSLLAIAELAPDMSLLAQPAPEVPVGNVGVTKQGAVTLTATPQSVSSSPATPGSPDTIKQQVARILASAPKPAPTSTGSESPRLASPMPALPAPVKSPDTPPLKSGGSFPPAGN